MASGRYPNPSLSMILRFKDLSSLATWSGKHVISLAQDITPSCEIVNVLIGYIEGQTKSIDRHLLYV